MKVLGLILELNPPHNGHKYFIDKARKLTNADIVIALVTTSFSMRGDVSVMDKFVKAKTALEMGVDFVFEYPIALAMQSADYFANNAIYILNNLGISDIAFGVENDDLSVLNYAKEIYKSDRFNLLLKEYLDKGYSYTLASHIALKEFGVDESIANDLSKRNQNTYDADLNFFNNTFFLW